MKKMDALMKLKHIELFQTQQWKRKNALYAPDTRNFPGILLPRVVHMFRMYVLLVLILTFARKLLKRSRQKFHVSKKEMDAQK